MTTETTTEATNSVTTYTKTEMVERAMKIGHKRKPIAIREWILENHHEDVSTDHISTIKSNLKKKKGTRKPRKTGDNDDAPVSRRQKGGDVLLSVDEIRQVLDLADDLGRHKIQQVLALLNTQE